MPAIDPDAASYFAAMTVQEPASTKRAVNAFVLACKSNSAGGAASSAWALLDRMTLPMGTEQAALRDLKQPAKTAINVNGCVFTAYRGFQGDAAAAYVDFGETPGGPSYSQNSATIFGYVNAQNAGETGVSNPVGITTTSGNVNIRPSLTTGGALSLNGAPASPPSFNGIALRRASWLAVRPNASTIIPYVNGVAQASIAVASAAPSAGTFCFLRQGAARSGDRVGAGGYGGAMTDAQAIQFQGDLHVLMTALGANY